MYNTYIIYIYTYTHICFGRIQLEYFTKLTGHLGSWNSGFGRTQPLGLPELHFGFGLGDAQLVVDR